jgi:tRNA (uracil-5-)-methyltransferase TRM9
MQKKTVKKLNEINKHFYEKVHKSLDQTRQYHWQGWEKMWAWINHEWFKRGRLNPRNLNQRFRVLDLGCGNGRFVSFLNKKLSDFEYLGLDNNKQLLQIAKNNYKSSNIEFKQADLLDDFTSIAKGKSQTRVQSSCFEPYKYDLICLFGVLHHIPGFKTRKKLLERCTKLLSKNGIIVITLWQFKNDPRYKDRLINPKKIGIEPKELEEGDYFLGWKDDEEAVRYCHYTSDEELKSIIPAKGRSAYGGNDQFTIKNSFLADGRSGKLNRYVIIS